MTDEKTIFEIHPVMIRAAPLLFSLCVLLCLLGTGFIVSPTRTFFGAGWRPLPAVVPPPHGGPAQSQARDVRPPRGHPRGGGSNLR